MEELKETKLYETFRRLIKHLIKQSESRFIRYKYNDINWNARMFGLVGPRGVGKTTMFLQYIQRATEWVAQESAEQGLQQSASQQASSQQASSQQETQMLYVSADNLYFADHTLVELAERFSKGGGKQLFIDEIHKYNNWSRELKQIYDTHPDLQVAFTGSSVLDIHKGSTDLSRRAPIYEMQGLSFREYLQLFHQIETSIYTLEEILSNKAEIPGIDHPLPFFADYLKRGYYPYSQDADFEIELGQTITQTMENDIPQYAQMNTSTGRKLKQLLVIIAKSVPFKPSMNTLAQIIGVSRNDLPEYFLYIEKAGMIGQLRDATGGIRGLGKVEKVYLDNPNLIYALGHTDSNKGNIRETFFYNQMRVKQEVILSKQGDFQIGDNIFEIGGKNKGEKQIAEAVQAGKGYIVKDDIETGYGNIIPLWSFGLNY